MPGGTGGDKPRPYKFRDVLGAGLAPARAM
jgi:hypothetical protein